MILGGKSELRRRPSRASCEFRPLPTWEFSELASLPEEDSLIVEGERGRWW